MKKLLALIALLVLTGPASAQKKFVVFTQGNWVYTKAAADLDFVNGRYYSGGYVPDIAAYVINSRGSNAATNLLPTSPANYAYKTYPTTGLYQLRAVSGVGLINEGARTNYYLNSANPSVGSATTATLTNAQHFLWVNAAVGGSVTLSAGTATGCGTGVATQGNPVTFTTSGSGNCTVTVAGTVYAAQIEDATNVLNLTSYVPTAGATQNRPSDFLFLTGLSAVDQVIPNIAYSGTGTIMCQTTRPRAATNDICFDAASGTDKWIRTNSGGTAFTSVSHAGVTLSDSNDGGPSDPTTDKVAIAWDGSGRCMVWNGGTPVCDSETLFSAGGTTMRLCQVFQAPCKRFTAWTTKLPNSTLQALTK